MCSWTLFFCKHPIVVEVLSLVGWEYPDIGWSGSELQLRLTPAPPKLQGNANKPGRWGQYGGHIKYPAFLVENECWYSGLGNTANASLHGKRLWQWDDGHVHTCDGVERGSSRTWVRSAGQWTFICTDCACLWCVCETWTNKVLVHSDIQYMCWLQSEMDTPNTEIWEIKRSNKDVYSDLKWTRNVLSRTRHRHA